MVGQWRQVSPNYSGNFYPLTPYTLANDAWVAWQFNRPEHGTGMVQAFRRTQNTDQTLHVKLRGLTADARHSATNFDVAGSTDVLGRVLMEKGLSVTVREKPATAIIAYMRKP